jgi:hypothetical protein
MGILHTAMNAEGSAVSASNALEDMARQLQTLADSHDLSAGDRAELFVKSRQIALYAAEVMAIATTGAAGRLAARAGEMVPTAVAEYDAPPF